MDHDKNKHCTETKYSQRYHYKDNIACGIQDDFNCVELSGKNSRHYPTISFRMPGQRHELEKVESLMENAYNRGLTDKMHEITNLLKTIIGL